MLIGECDDSSVDYSVCSSPLNCSIGESESSKTTVKCMQQLALLYDQFFSCTDVVHVFSHSLLTMNIVVKCCVLNVTAKSVMVAATCNLHGNCDLQSRPWTIRM